MVVYALATPSLDFAGASACRKRRTPRYGRASAIVLFYGIAVLERPPRTAASGTARTATC